MVTGQVHVERSVSVRSAWTRIHPELERPESASTMLSRKLGATADRHRGYS